jgi:hypothetical protein
MKSVLTKLVASFARINWPFVPADDGRSTRWSRSFEIGNRTIRPAAPANDLVSGIAYLVLAGSLFVSLLEFLAAVP